VEQYKEQLIEYQINNHQLQEKMREIERENLKARDTFEQEQKMRSTAEVDNVRQRQSIDDLKQEMLHLETKSKSMLYERTAQLSDKDREIYRLKEENLEVEKLYLNEKERLQRKQEKGMRDLAALYKEFEALRRELASLKTDSNKAIDNERAKFKQTLSEVTARIELL
jgi:hypothetical protein